MLQPRCFMKSALHFCFFSSGARFSHLFFLFLARLDNVSCASRPFMIAVYFAW